jgi:hypothetical protein
MRHIRPYKIFSLLDAPASQRTVNISLPSRHGVGGTSLLETLLIIAACRTVDARRVFEFGTFFGSNTLNMALNTPTDGKVYTLDLDEQRIAEVEQHPADALLTQLHLASQSSLDFAGSPVAGKIEALVGNSTAFDFSQWKDSMDFIFIDGGHDPFTVKSDTENALKMAAKATPSCIMWHDYRNWDYAHLTCYLDELAQERQLFHVGDTMLCAWFNDPNGSILARLNAE